MASASAWLSGRNDLMLLVHISLDARELLGGTKPPEHEDASVVPDVRDTSYDRPDVVHVSLIGPQVSLQPVDRR